MLGDAILAEPGAVIGFAGPRVIKQTLGQDLPEGLPDRGVPARPRDARPRRPSARAQADGGPAPSAHERQAGRDGVGVALSDVAPDTARARLPLRSHHRQVEARPRAHGCALRALGDPHDRLRVAPRRRHEREGSVCATLETRAAREGAARRQVHLAAPRRFSRALPRRRRRVDEDYVVDFIERWTPTVERIGATFFEATTAMAFDLFAREDVDVAVIETGLGGRLDSTNVVRPLAAGVTSIGIDHVEYLGETREEIAAEKAGIFKPGVPAVIGERDRADRALLADMARARGAAPILDVVARRAAERRRGRVATGRRSTSTVGGERATLRTPLAGAHQASNASLALLMLRRGRRIFATTLDEARARARRRPPAGPVSPRRPVHLRCRAQSRRRRRARRDGGGRRAAGAGRCRAMRARRQGLAWRHGRAGAASSTRSCSQTRRPRRRAAPGIADEAVALRARARVDAAVGARLRRGPRTRDADARARCSSPGSFHTVGDAMARLHVDPLAG